jgi:phosphoribosylformylglycinamidine cyclo-ligase
MPEEKDNITYEGAGVSRSDKESVDREIVRILTGLGMKPTGLFAGSIDVSSFKGKGNLFLDINGASLAGPLSDMIDAGKHVARAAFWNCRRSPIGVLDYFASASMNPTVIGGFVKGVGNFVALQDVNRKLHPVEGEQEPVEKQRLAVIGGETAQMLETYYAGMFDSFVHVLSLSRKRSEFSVLNIADLVNGMEHPMLMVSTDGTGTKTKIVRDPADIIHHGFSDVSVQGAVPILFALYIAGNTSKQELHEIDRRANCLADLLGVAKAPSLIEVKEDVYLPGEVDIAGTVVGIVDKKDMITGAGVQEGHKIIGIASDGLMTNGYTLARDRVRRLMDKGVVVGWDYPVAELGGNSLEYELSRPHVFYADILFGDREREGVLSAFKGAVKGMAHITGGGQPGNIPRMIPRGLKAVVQKDVLPVPPIMQYLIEHGADREDAYNNAFNMGVGLTLTASPLEAGSIRRYINDNFRYALDGIERRAAIIGEIRKADGEERFEWGRVE